MLLGKTKNGIFWGKSKMYLLHLCFTLNSLDEEWLIQESLMMLQTSFRLFSEKSKLITSLDKYSSVFYSLFSLYAKLRTIKIY